MMFTTTTLAVVVVAAAAVWTAGSSSVVVSAFVPTTARRVAVPQQQNPLRAAAAVSAAGGSDTTTSASSPPPMAPLTAWGERIDDIRRAQEEMRQQNLPDFTVTISAVDDLQLSAADTAGQLRYLRDHAAEIKQLMVTHGAVIFRDFDLMKTQDGFQQFYDAIGMKVCLDPLHSVSARPTVNGKKNSPVYEAVNKESRKNFFIGMHNEFVGTRAPRAAAFVCFKAAERGGEFLLADGRRVFRDLDPALVEELYGRQIRYSVMELPFFGWIDGLPAVLQQPVQSVVKAAVSAAVNAKVDFNVELLWGDELSAGGKGSAYDSEVKLLQARAPSQPPIVLHPVTKDPTWFCNVHSHSSKLRKDREAIYGAERFEDGASRINKSDMFFGDDGMISEQQLRAMDDVTSRHIKYVKMTEGDVVLLDNYSTMHGRNVFDGARKHGVAWFEGWQGEQDMMEQQDQQQKSSVQQAKEEETPFFASLT